MTVEEKAKAYDIIVQRVTELYETGTTLTKEQMEYLFPELRENKDDRIRKRICLCLDECVHSDIIRDYERDECLVYLEKQKEYVSDNFDDVWTTEDCTEIIEAGEKLTPKFKELLKEVCHAWYDKGIELKKQKEQKHYWKPTETDVALFNKAITTNKALTPAERAQLDIIRSKFGYCRTVNCSGIVQEEQKLVTFNEPYNPDEYEVVMEGNAISLKRKEQKPAIWTEEDEKNLCELLAYGETRLCLRRWIAGLPEKIKGLQQKPAEWSEEDKKMLANTIFKLAGFMGNEKNIDWLKSIRPSWKPSEEQMEALRYVAYKFGDSHLSPYSILNKALASLYEQLKKL